MTAEPPETVDAGRRRARIVPAIADIAAADWDRCANPDTTAFNPFVAHAFLEALETSGSVGPGTGWRACHLVLDDGASAVEGVMPLYLKTHSQGEYVFDHGWANAYAQAGGRYYPKLQCAVPFSPVPGPRLLVAPGPDAPATRARLVRAAIAVTRQLDVSSLHATFLTEADADVFGAAGFLRRTDTQFHWHNAGYGTFDDFLASLASRKRKTVRRERAEALGNGLSIRRLTGSDIREAHWDAMHAFYMDTGSRKWGRPYLNRAFFSRLGETFAGRCLMIMVERDGRAVAGALNMIGGDCLYGRYWGAVEHHPCLHFEVCYYQAIDYAIAHGLKRVEAGAQGEHKIARGYVPVTTHSAHWIADEALRKAVARYLEHERAEVASVSAALAEYAPYKRGGGPLDDHD